VACVYIQAIPQVSASFPPHLFDIPIGAQPLYGYGFEEWRGCEEGRGCPRIGGRRGSIRRSGVRWFIYFFISRSVSVCEFLKWSLLYPNISYVAIFCGCNGFPIGNLCAGFGRLAEVLFLKVFSIIFFRNKSKQLPRASHERVLPLS